MEVHIRFIGFLLIGLSLVHGIFPKYFDWKQDLVSLTLINRQMMIVHTFFIALVVFLMGVLCITSYQDLINTNIGRRVCLGIGLFWFVRLIVQFFGYASVLWKGKTFETAIHILFSALWIYLSWIFLYIFFYN